MRTVLTIKKSTVILPNHLESFAVKVPQAQEGSGCGWPATHCKILLASFFGAQGFQTQLNPRIAACIWDMLGGNFWEGQNLRIAAAADSHQIGGMALQLAVVGRSLSIRANPTQGFKSGLRMWKRCRAAASFKKPASHPDEPKQFVMGL